MAFKAIKFYNFRNINNQQLLLCGKNIFFIGNNGQGKTNILEALYLLKYGSSFRIKKEQEIINFEEKECSLTGIYSKDNIKDQINYQIQNRKIKIKINSQIIKDRKELLNFSSMIVFNHDDIFIISGAPEYRRKFFDQSIALTNFNYIDALKKYKKILKQRNYLLKEKNINYLDTIDQQLLIYGKKLQKERQVTINKFNQGFQTLYRKISNTQTDISISYKPSWKEPEKDLYKNREKDLFYKTTTSGPHRDKYLFLSGKKDFSRTASTGQKRLLALILKLRKTIYLTEINKEKSILLFDDVLLELDGQKRKEFLKNIPEYEQAFFTFLPEEPYQKYYNNEKREIFFVKEGAIIKNEKNI